MRKKFTPSKDLNIKNEATIQTPSHLTRSGSQLRRVQTFNENVSTPKITKCKINNYKQVNHQAHHRIENMQSLNLNQNDCQQTESEAASISLSKNRQKSLKFKVKAKFVKDEKLTKQQKLFHKLRTAIDNLNKIIESLDILAYDINYKFAVLTDQLSILFAQKIKQFIQKTQQKHNKNIVMQQFKRQKMVENKQERVEKKEKIQQELKNQISKSSETKKFSQNFTLDLSVLQNKDEEYSKTHHNTTKQKRQAQTQRHVAKTFDFDAPCRATRKLQSFNEVLNKIKRLSFGGSILKL